MKKIILCALTALLCASTMQPAFGMEDNDFFDRDGQPSLLPEDQQQPVQNVTINIGLVPIPVVQQQRQLENRSYLAATAFAFAYVNRRRINEHIVEKHSLLAYKVAKEKIKSDAKVEACIQGISLGLGLMGMKAAYNLPSDYPKSKIALCLTSAFLLALSSKRPAVYKKTAYKDIRSIPELLPEHRRKLKKKCHEKFFWPSAIAKALPISGAIAANMQTSSNVSTTALEAAKIFPAVLAATAGAAYINNGFWRTYKKWSREHARRSPIAVRF